MAILAIIQSASRMLLCIKIVVNFYYHLFTEISTGNMTTPQVPGTVICFDLDAEDNSVKEKDVSMEKGSKGSISPAAGYDSNGSAPIHNSPATVIDMRGVVGEGK